MFVTWPEMSNDAITARGYSSMIMSLTNAKEFFTVCWSGANGGENKHQELYHTTIWRTQCRGYGTHKVVPLVYLRRARPYTWLYRYTMWNHNIRLSYSSSTLRDNYQECLRTWSSGVRDPQEVVEIQYGHKNKTVNTQSRFLDQGE